MLGGRVPVALRVFVAALAVVDDVLSVLVLAIFFPHMLAPAYAAAVFGCVAGLYALNRARVYANWPYLLVGLALWLSLHALGVHAALSGVILAVFLPTLPAPRAAPLLAQAATALAALEQSEAEGEREGAARPPVEREPVWEWAARNLSAASERFLSPAERIERAVAPWTAYFILPLFALSATGVRIATNFESPDAVRIFEGVVCGLVLGKPVGILLSSGLAIRFRLATPPESVGIRDFLGGACLCGVGDTMALLVADRAFDLADASVAKLAILTGSTVAAIIGMLILRVRPAALSTLTSG